MLAAARAIAHHRSSEGPGEGPPGRGFFEDLGLCWVVSQGLLAEAGQFRNWGVFVTCLGARRVKVGIVVVMEEAAGLLLVKRGGC